MDKGIVIFVYDHFYPDFSAGGPVTSLVNLSNALSGKLNCRILTSAYKYSSGIRMNVIEADRWTDKKEVLIWYATSWQNVAKGLNDLPHNKNTILYLNGIFSPLYFLYPLWLASLNGFSVIISPRGMLQSGALKIGSMKKRLYITSLKFSGLLRNVTYHATDWQESSDIKSILGHQSNVKIVPNWPAAPGNTVIKIEKVQGELRLIYFSLIAQKKNLLFLLRLLDTNELSNLKLDIAGPIKDLAYWEECQPIVKVLERQGRVRYLGEVSPEKSRDLLPGYHALILPTLGENFGHAIVEMLACSRPVMISDKTPWLDLEIFGAGYALPLIGELWIEKLLTMLSWDQEAFDKSCSSSLEYYHYKFDFKELEAKYLKLFLTDSEI